MNPLVVPFLSVVACPVSSNVSEPVPTFTRFAVPDHPAVAFAPGRIRVLVGRAPGGVDRTIVRDGVTTRPFRWNGQTVACVVVHEEAWEEGHLVERSRTFLAQSDQGTVYTFGELDDFEDEDGDDDGPQGWVVGGLLPDESQEVLSVEAPLVHTPARLEVGTVWRSEVPPVGERLSLVVASGVTRVTGAGTFDDCVEILEHDPAGDEVERAWLSATGGLVARASEEDPGELVLDVLSTSLGRASVSLEQVGERGPLRARVEVVPRSRCARLRVLDPFGSTLVEVAAPAGPDRFQFELTSARALKSGRYRFLAEALDGTSLYEEHELALRLPDAPIPIAPPPGQLVDAPAVHLRWSPSSSAVRLVVREVGSHRMLAVDPDPRATAYDLSAWTSPGREYEVELIAAAPGGNRRGVRFGFATRE